MTEHDHSRPVFPPVHAGVYGDADDPTRPLDQTPIEALLGAAHARCVPCQQRLVDVVAAGDPAVATHLAGMAWYGLSVVQDAVAPALPGDVGEGGLPGPARAVMGALRRHGPAEACQQMRALGPAARREVLDCALDLIAGLPALADVEIVHIDLGGGR